MARQIQDIQNQIQANITADPVLGSQLNSTSQTAKYKLFSYIIAVSIGYFEQLVDIFVNTIEDRLGKNAYGHPRWIQQKCFDFQAGYALLYQTDKTSIYYQNFYYPVIDNLAKIVTQCSVNTLPSRVISVKVAYNSTPLTTPQKTELKSYLIEQLPAGVLLSITSVAGDTLTFAGDISFNGQYSDTIQASVEGAITNYLNNVRSFNGNMYTNEIIEAVMKIDGVINFTINNLSNVDTNANTTILITSGTWLTNNINPFSGYFQTSNFTGITYTAS